MRPRQRGSIQVAGDGTWRVHIDFPRQSGERRKQLTRRGRSESPEQARIAAEVALKALNDERASHHVLSGRESLASYLERWLEFTAERDDVRATTVARYRQLLELHVVPAVGKYTLKKIEDEPEIVQRAYTRARREGKKVRSKNPATPGAKESAPLTGRTVLHVHRVLSSALKQAVRWKLIRMNPCDAVIPPSAKRIEMRTLDAPEVRQLVAASESSRLHGPIVLAVSVGLRRGEALGLKWGDVDFERGTLSVQRSLQPGGELVEPKTTRSRRTIALPPYALDVLRGYREEQYGWFKASMSELEARRRQKDGLVFSGPQGEPWKAASIATLFRGIAKRAGVGHLRFHDLRHTAASLMIERGVPITTVAETLGHANTATTMSVYAHSVKGAEDLAAKAMDNVLKGVIDAR